MKDYKLLFIIGLIVLVFPFLGFPAFFRNLVIELAGAFLIGYAIYIKTSYTKQNGTKPKETILESNVESDLETDSKEESIIEGEAFEEEIIKKDNE